MFRFVCDPSSESTELCLTEITLSGSQIFFVCLVGVWRRDFEPAVCVHGTTGCSPRRDFEPAVCVHGTTGCSPSYRARKFSVNFTKAEVVCTSC